MPAMMPAGDGGNVRVRAPAPEQGLPAGGIEVTLPALAIDVLYVITGDLADAVMAVDECSRWQGLAPAASLHPAYLLVGGEPLRLSDRVNTTARGSVSRRLIREDSLRAVGQALQPTRMAVQAQRGDGRPSERIIRVVM